MCIRDSIVVAWDDDPSGSVDTGAAAVLDRYRERHEGAYREILAALASRDARTFLQGTTVSACINDRYLPKASFYLGHRLARATSGGMIVAHTGTCIGVACEDADQAAWVTRRVRSAGIKPFRVHFGGAN